MKDTKKNEKIKYNKSIKFTKALVTTAVLSNTLLTPISTLAATNTGSADVATTLNDAEDYVDLQKRLNQGDLLKNSLPKNEEVEQDTNEENKTVEEDSSENVEEKEDNTTKEVEKEVVQDEEKDSSEQGEKNKKDEEKVEGTVSEVKESTNNEKVDSKEKSTKVTQHSKVIDGVTYSWTFDNGVVVMDVSSAADATAKGVAVALESVHSKADITSLTVSEIKTFVGEGTDTSASHFQEYTALKTVNLPQVTILGDYAFYNASSLTSVNIPQVTTIGISAFYRAISLKSVDFPKATTIGASAFSRASNLEIVNIPSATTIGENIFYNASSVKTLNIGMESNTTVPTAVTVLEDIKGSLEDLTIQNMENVSGYLNEKGSLNALSKLKKVSFPKATHVGLKAFKVSGIQSVDLPEVITVSNEAFSGMSSLQNINLPKATTIGHSALKDTHSLQSINLPKATTIDDQAFSCTLPNVSSLQSINLPKATTIGWAAFRNTNSLQSINLPEATTIDDDTFSNSNLESISAPKVTTIGNHAFNNAKYLKSVDMPKVTTVGHLAFAGTKNLKSIDFPEVTKLGRAVFFYATSLEYVNIPKVTTLEKSRVTEWEWDALYEADTNTLTKVTDGASIFEKASSLKTLNIGMESTTTAEELATILVDAKKSLKDLTVQNMIGFEGNQSQSYLKDFTNLETVSLPKVTTVGNNAFFGAKNLTDVDMPKVVTIGNNVFNGASSLEGVNMPELTTIGSGAFNGASSLKSVNVRMKSTTTANDVVNIFASAKGSLKDLTVQDMVSFQGNTNQSSYLKDFTELETVNLPKVTTIGNYAFYAMRNLTNVDIPESITIGNNAFFGVSILENIDISKVTTIGEYAFQGTSSLKTLDLPEIKSFGINIFDNSGVELITTKNDNRSVVKGVLKEYGILGVVTDAPELKNQTLSMGSSLSLSNLAIINDSLTGVKATVSSSWEKDGEEVGNDLTYSVDSVSEADAGVYQNTLDVTLSDGTTGGSFQTNEANITVKETEADVTVKQGTDVEVLRNMLIAKMPQGSNYHSYKITNIGNVDLKKVGVYEVTGEFTAVMNVNTVKLTVRVVEAESKAVTVKYVDEEGEEIVSSEELTGKWGEEYTSEAKEIEGYVLKEVVGETTGTFTNEEQVVTYVYETEQGADVTARYVDEEGNQITYSVKLTGKFGKEYTTEVKEFIKGYVLKETPSNATGAFSKEEQTVTYVYERIEDEVESNNQDITFKNQTVTLKIGDKFDDSVKELINPRMAYRHVDNNSLSDFSKLTWANFDWDLSNLDVDKAGTYTISVDVNKITMNSDGNRLRYAKGSAEITVVVEDEVEETTPYNEFKLGYWRHYGFVLEGTAGLTGVNFETSESVKKTVEIVDEEGTVVQSISATNANWYDASNYDGYQAIISNDVLGVLADGSYKMQVRIEVDGKEYVEPITEKLNSRSWIGTYRDSIADIETGYAHGNQIQFGNMMGQMTLSATSTEREWNPLADYKLSDGTRIIDAMVAADYDYSQEHTKELVVKDKEGNVVYNTQVSTWNVKEMFNMQVKAEWERSGVQVMVASEYQTADYTCYVVVKDASSGKVAEVEVEL